MNDIGKFVIATFPTKTEAQAAVAINAESIVRFGIAKDGRKWVVRAILRGWDIPLELSHGSNETVLLSPSEVRR